MKKTVNALMKYMRNEKNISINGSKEKKQLLNIGYFHGFKGYRFMCDPKQELKYENFEQLMAVYNFDMHLKAILYPYIMSIETAFKSHTLETCVELCSYVFIEVYNKILNKYEKYDIDSVDYIRALKVKHNIRNIVYTSISEKYNCEHPQDTNKMITHYKHQGKPVPLWAIFEILTLGQFGIFVSTMNDNASKNLAINLDLYYSNIDEHGRLVQDIIYFLTDLRNAIAHNSIVFDCRFMRQNPPKRIKKLLELEIGINTSFKYFDDYIVLIVVILLKLKYSKNEVKRLVRNYLEQTEKLREQVPIDIYNKILGTETKRKTNILLKL